MIYVLMYYGLVCLISEDFKHISFCARVLASIEYGHYKVYDESYNPAFGTFKKEWVYHSADALGGEKAMIHLVGLTLDNHDRFFEALEIAQNHGLGNRMKPEKQG